VGRADPGDRGGVYGAIFAVVGGREGIRFTRSIAVAGVRRAVALGAPSGKAIWTYKIGGPWSAQRLKNGNTLITSYPTTVVEVNRQGEVVWKFTQEDAPLYRFFILQEAPRLANGNTVITNWCPNDLKANPKKWPGSVQVIEVNAG
jgi:outer membrane protein assembly factor BamB